MKGSSPIKTQQQQSHSNIDKPPTFCLQFKSLFPGLQPVHINIMNSSSEQSMTESFATPSCGTKQSDVTGIHFSDEEVHFTQPATIFRSVNPPFSISVKSRQIPAQSTSDISKTAIQDTIVGHVAWLLERRPPGLEITSFEDTLTLTIPIGDRSSPSIRRIRLIMQSEVEVEEMATLTANEIQRPCVMTVSVPTGASFHWKIPTRQEHSFMKTVGLEAVHFDSTAETKESMNDDDTMARVDTARLYWRYTIHGNYDNRSWAKEFLVDFGERSRSSRKRMKYMISQKNGWSGSIADDHYHQKDMIRFAHCGKKIARKSGSKQLFFRAFTFEKIHTIRPMEGGFLVHEDKKNQPQDMQDERWDYGLQGRAWVHHAKVDPIDITGKNPDSWATT